MKTDVVLPDETAKEVTVEEPPKPVHLDFAKKDPPGAAPFQKAKTVEKRLKLFLWGDSGAGKTTLALQFPKPVVIDLEGGCDLYGEAFQFDVLKATTADQVSQAVDWLLTNKHDYRTLVIDPITVYWDALQKKWSDIFLKRNKSSKGYRFEFYDLQPRDWLTLKAEFKDLIRKLIALDMNVIITARQKTQYKEGSFMVAMGETFDGEKSLPYLFDTIVRLFVDEKGRHMGAVLKDRSNKLPKDPFEAKYPLFESLFGKQSLARKPKPVAVSTDDQKSKIKALIAQVGMPEEQVTERLGAYGAETLEDLTAENAALILQKLEAAVASLNSKSTPQGGRHA
ncbi:MAG: hypothetical protein A2992_06460 [Elusimicrobia bacterium RIFCSPLOWO2_01_FULL_59_12]|nr:MAG: hypothetical protein A2992_06460 [Elusimicrobia bacterium RIFCSPLOWO2_01_FULL_59_12]